MTDAICIALEWLLAVAIVTIATGFALLILWLVVGLAINGVYYVVAKVRR